MLVGTAPVDEFVACAATMPDFSTDAVTFPGSEVFQAMFEMHVAGRERSLPPCLHPTGVPTFSVQVWRCPESPWGAFSLVQGRVGARSGLRPRAHVQGCVCDNDDALAAFRARWGFPARLGAVRWRRAYDAVEVEVTVGEQTVLAVRGVDPEPLGPADIAYTVAVVLAHTPRGLRLVQVDYDVEVDRAERLRPHLAHVDVAGFGMHPAVSPYHPVSASLALGAVRLGRLRYAGRPDELAFTGTETLDA